VGAGVVRDAERLAADAEKAEDAGRLVSARGAYLRAANYYSTGLYLITRSSAPERHLETWKRHRACWDKFVDLAAVPGERLQLPYQDTTLPGYVFRAPDAAPGERRPLVVLNNGSDGATSHMGLFGGRAANERGYHAMTFDGPGQQASLFLQGIPFRHDWEAVLTPVVDAMAARPDVDPDRIALIGSARPAIGCRARSPSSIAFAAAVADPGVVDVSTSWTRQLPGFMRSQLQDPVQEGLLRQGDGLERAVLQLDAGHPPLPRRAVRRGRRLALRPLPGGAEVPAGRRGPEHHHPHPDHRARGRTVLARPVTGAVRPAAGSLGSW
jgi:hypothetical protein